MNAGANGVETRERVVEVRAFDRKGELHVLSNADMGYAYRHSSASPDLIFTSALFEGIPGDREEIQKAMDEVQNHRETVQPVREKPAAQPSRILKAHLPGKKSTRRAVAACVLVARRCLRCTAIS